MPHDPDDVMVLLDLCPSCGSSLRVVKNLEKPRHYKIVCDKCGLFIVFEDDPDKHKKIHDVLKQKSKALTPSGDKKEKLKGGKRNEQ